jgi:hypothetical protein
MRKHRKRRLARLLGALETRELLISLIASAARIARNA